MAGFLTGLLLTRRSVRNTAAVKKAVAIRIALTVYVMLG